MNHLRSFSPFLSTGLLLSATSACSVDGSDSDTAIDGNSETANGLDGDGDATGGTGPGGTDVPGAGGTGSGAAAGGSGATAGGAGTGGTGNPSSGTCSNRGDGQNPDRVCIQGKLYYLNGINVAWDKWNGDLENYDAAKFETLFSDLSSAGANAIRWWWFIDGSQITYNGHLAQPLSQAIFNNLDAAFDAAAAHGIKIMPVFLSFDIKTPGRTWLVTEEAAMDAFNANVVAPLVQRYTDHPGMGIWEIMNEPDWLLNTENGEQTLAQVQRFHGKMAAAIHTADADAIVTTGMGMFKYMTDSGNNFSDAALKAATDGNELAFLDVYQTHYYAWQKGFYEPWTKTSTQWLGEGKPVLIGEFACKGETGGRTSLQMHTEAVTQGFAGSFCWAYFDNRADKEGYWPDAEPGMKAIADMIPAAMTGE